MSRFVIYLLLLLFVVFLFSRQRRTQQRQAAQQRDSLQLGARVMTTSGLHGTVVAVQGDTVELEVAPGVRTTWLARAVARRLDDPVTAAAPPEGAADTSAPGPGVLSTEATTGDDDTRGSTRSGAA